MIPPSGAAPSPLTGHDLVGTAGTGLRKRGLNTLPPPLNRNDGRPLPPAPAAPQPSFEGLKKPPLLAAISARC